MIRGMRAAALPFVPLALLAAMPVEAAPPIDTRATYAALGQTVVVHGRRITPLHVIEDSRCPSSVTCVWAGRVRLSVRVDRAVREMTLGHPLRVAGGALRLSSVLPARTRTTAIAPRAYRFGFRFERDDGKGMFELIRD
jgi:hypothetical protein